MDFSTILPDTNMKKDIIDRLPTPETDKVEERQQGMSCGGVNLGFARRLERERDAAIIRGKAKFSVALACLEAIINDLPHNRDWLNPDHEKLARLLIANSREMSDET